MSKNRITLGTTGDDPVHMDAGVLVKTRMLVTANSGGGKSYALRKVFEQVGRSAQLIVLDMEGEFVTLREKLDMVIVGPGGEIPADVRAAGLLARRLVERELSAVIDMSELRAQVRRDFVKLFCETLVELPKSLWHPLFVGLDEAHQFCPEKGQGEATSTQAVIDLCTLGRKRGFCSILATQRISTLNKTAAGECNNKLIGRMTLDVDIKRAAFELGTSASETVKLLRDRKAGEFYGFGPAFDHTGVFPVTVDKVETTHPEAGKGQTLTPPKPSSAISAVVAELTDLPKEAEAEIKDLAAAKQKMTTLERELKAARAVPKGTATPQQLRDAQQQAKANAAVIARLKKGLEDAMKVIAEINAKGFEKTDIDPALVEKAVKAAADQIVKAAQQRLASREQEFADWKKKANKLLGELQKLIGNDIKASVDVQHNEPFSLSGPATSGRPVVPAGPLSPMSDGLTSPQQAILDVVKVLNNRGIEPSRDAVARWLAIHPKGGSYGTNLGMLRAEGYLDGFTLTDKGKDAARELPTGMAAALAALPDEPKRTIVNKLVELGRAVSRDELAEALGLHPKGGSYGTNLGWLRTMGLITPKGPIKTTEALNR